MPRISLPCACTEQPHGWQCPSHYQPLADALAAAGETFRRYEKMHTEKGTPGGVVKAMANAAEAERCEAALAAVYIPR